MYYYSAMGKISSTQECDVSKKLELKVRQYQLCANNMGLYICVSKVTKSSQS